MHMKIQIQIEIKEQMKKLKNKCTITITSTNTNTNTDTKTCKLPQSGCRRRQQEELNRCQPPPQNRLQMILIDAI